MGDFLGVDERTVRRWRHAHPDFDQALIIGSEAANRRVEASLYQQAIGYWLVDEEIRVVGGNIVRVEKQTYVPPNVSAAIYWTKARMGWRDNDRNGGSSQDAPPPESVEPPQESIRQTARRVALLLYQAGHVNEEQ